MKHVMVDLETLGTVPGCAILSIGAVEFLPDVGKMGKEFYIVVNRASCGDAFLKEEPGTVKWWTDKSPDARQVLADAANKKKSVPLKLALEKFNDYLKSVGGFRELRVYGNGADFDNPIMRVAYDAVGVPHFGSTAGFFGGRCYRTLKSLDELFGGGHAAPKMQRQGTYHNALDDAKSQAGHLMEIVAAIRAGRK